MKKIGRQNINAFHFTKLVVSTLVLSSLISACGKSEWREVKNPNTGDATAEVKTGDIVAAHADQTAYVVPERLRGRETPDQNPTESTTLLERNQEVQIVDPTPIGEDQVVSVRFREPKPVVQAPAPAPAVPAVTPVKPLVKKSMAAPVVLEAKKAPAPKSPATPTPTPTPVPKAKPVAKKLYVPLKYLKKAPVEVSVSENEADRYIMIQNIATEKLRVYERATVSGQPNKLVFEVDMIAGENNPSKTRRTAVGSYKIEKWVKFYQDNQGLFPSWHDSTLASVPLPGASLQDWTQSYLMPTENGQAKGLVRGAFGWYTAKIGPNAHAQWTHGTLGWGADQDRFIKLPKTQLEQFYGDPRSFGCTRVENRAIAFLQELLPVGTRVIKVYAREAISDKTLARYKDSTEQHFDFILTNDEVRKEKPQSSLRAAQLLRDVKESSVIETGSYALDVTPDAVQFKKTVKGERLEATMIRPEANLYDLSEASFQGEFLVDEGRFVNYKHPSELRKGGYSDNLLPSVVIKK